MVRKYVWVGLLLAATSGCVSTYQKDWVEIRSQHFVVQSALGQDQAKQLAVDLERFRQVVAQVTTSGELEPSSRASLTSATICSVTVLS